MVETLVSVEEYLGTALRWPPEVRQAVKTLLTVR